MVTRFSTLRRAEKRPGSLLLGPGMPDDPRAGDLPSGGGASLTEATSNLKAGETVCARTVTPSNKMNAMAAATANDPTTASSGFWEHRFFAGCTGITHRLTLRCSDLCSRS